MRCSVVCFVYDLSSTSNPKGKAVLQLYRAEYREGRPMGFRIISQAMIATSPTTVHHYNLKSMRVLRTRIFILRSSLEKMVQGPDIQA